MTSEDPQRLLGPHRTRRNIIALGATLGAAMLGGCKNDPGSLGLFHDDDRRRHHLNCFLRGTKIKTIGGERPIERLEIGDLLPTVFNGLRPIKEIRNYKIKRAPTEPWPQDALPIKIAASAISPGIPHSDLYLTPGHALLLDDILIPAGSLRNGVTIDLYDSEEYSEIEYFHIKLEAHDVVYAEGAKCESIFDGRRNLIDLDNASDFVSAELLDGKTCVPVYAYNGARSEIKSRLRSAISPWLDFRTKIDIVRDSIEDRCELI